MIDDEKKENTRATLIQIWSHSNPSAALDYLLKRLPDDASQLEAIVLPLVDHIFQNNIVDFVEEAAELFEVFSSLTRVSARGWLTFQHIYNVF